MEEHFLNDGDACFSFMRTSREAFFDPARIHVDDYEQGHNRKCDQGELPIDDEHHRDHAGDRDHVHHDAEHGRSHKVLDRLDITGYTADQVTCASLIVLGERQFRDVVIKGPPQIMSHPLPHARAQVFFAVGADGVDQGDDGYGENGNIEDGELTGTGYAVHDQASQSGMRLACNT